MLKQGIYEEIINQKLKDELTSLYLNSYDIGKERLDVEEARKLLSSYISLVTMLGELKKEIIPRS
ncbi:hypothetical protein ELQ35_11675 [Peribacillus cavernae]|uniref:Uncharacterized protein n=1 Tax=Peribacillus cavernae TaxID=1674310 RepID=A0A3S1B4V6_9BACI|nr:hypothetical protein [Peribacillus cavernae]MDQ0219206.1 hypothetical protein [Peribacillus cavernae]RUQ28574.1 hypothetical protein ELQ35_11675 [Peribacillus cavernae]